ncbi:MAG TPA: hypothetical protein VN854_01400 [Mycoplasmatales bacterium]|nr:hypothetical protein [Mycoplasmatales bacterium]
MTKFLLRILYTENENIQKFVDYLCLYLVDELRLKLLLFMLWDIDNYVGNKDINRISYIFYRFWVRGFYENE